MEDPKALKERIESLTGRVVYGLPRVVDDTTDYMGISAGSVLFLEGAYYYITGEAKEGRFGISEQPKFWVKYGYDLTDGARKILKLVFHEHFTATLGMFTVQCRRDPDKESRVLAAVDGDSRFMQGRTVHDAVGNNVRILDFIRGTSLYSHIAMIDQSHEVYFHETLPGVLRKVLVCMEAIDSLHRKGEQHGDIRNDHILIDRETGDYRWIDFDYSVNYLDYDVWSIGNILTYVVGKGIRTCDQARKVLSARGGGGSGSVDAGDAMLFFNYRMANLRKIYPYIPPELNELLMRFSASTLEAYETVGAIVADARSLFATLLD